MKRVLLKIVGIFFLCLAILFGGFVSGPNYNYIIGISLGAGTISLICFGLLFRQPKGGSRVLIGLGIALSAFFVLGGILYFIEQLLT